jgi:Response regulator containing a CheY-like receiver domain and an HTH DNA-binding domain
MQARILIADDNPVVRRTLKHLLETLPGVEVSEAEDGQSAIARALELHPDIIILDLAMPGMDGLMAAREISKVIPEPVILMYTMHWSKLLELEAQKSGVRKLVSKAQSNVLLAEVREALAARPPNPQPEEIQLPTPEILPPSAAEASSPNPSPATAADPSVPAAPAPKEPSQEN